MTEQRSGGSGLRRAHRPALWHVLGVGLMVLLPGLVRLGRPFWELTPALALQSAVPAVGYLLFAVVLSSWFQPSRRRSIRAVAVAGVVGVACFGASAVGLLVLPQATYSRLLLAVAVALGVPIAMAPHVMRGERDFRGALAVLLLAVGATALWAAYPGVSAPSSAFVEQQHGETTIVGADGHTVRITHHIGIVDPGPSWGGGLDAYGDQFVLSNSVGRFYRVWWDELDLRSEPLGLPPLLNRDEFIEDNSLASENRVFRVIDVLVDTVSRPPRILASHYVWHRDERCLTIRISAVPLVDGGAPSDPPIAWETEFDAKPCIAFGTGERLTNHSGGRMAWAADGRLLFSVGDMLRSGSGEVLPQEPGADYGKILLLDRGGDVELYSLGHRNPEGLMVARDGSVWSTEHGPRGGDELNRILPGRNYGWPIATYGTLDDGDLHPLTEHRRNHGSYEGPLFAWIPSVGVSQLVELSGKGLPEWEGDLLVASLNGRSLFRLRLQEGRVVYSEPLEIGHRVRDLVEDPEGRLVLYTDAGELVTIVEEEAITGETVFAVQCASCHQEGRGVPASGPDLGGVLGRQAASLPGYPYSAALREVDGAWNEANLDAFLADPSRFAPGTNMIAEGLDEPDRRAVIGYLETYR